MIRDIVISLAGAACGALVVAFLLEKPKVPSPEKQKPGSLICTLKIECECTYMTLAGRATKLPNSRSCAKMRRYNMTEIIFEKEELDDVRNELEEFAKTNKDLK